MSPRHYLIVPRRRHAVRVEAALRAGIGIIGLRCGGWPAEALKGALAVYDDPADLVERYDVSPFKRPVPLPSP